jgi:ABC-type Fe3+-siderophore transport system permease subunit
MNVSQSAGMAVVVLVVVAVDLPVGWLVPLATLCGGLATFAVTMWMQTR